MAKSSFNWNGYRVEFNADVLDELGRVGDCDFHGGVIRRHPKEKGKTALDTLIHEGIHALDPDLSEAKVGMMGRALAELAWKAGYRLQEKP